MKISDFEKVKKFPYLAGDGDTMQARFRELDWLGPMISDTGWNLEFGVHTGSTINCLATIRPDLEFVGFDSFEGLPESWDMGQKVVGTDAFDRKGEMPEVTDNVELVKGFFNDSLPEWLKSKAEHGYVRPEPSSESISFLHVDSDIYSSAVTIFEYLNDYIKPGCIIRFDELSCWRYVFHEASPTELSRVYYTTWKDHEWKALHEWMDKNDRKVAPLCRNWFQSGTVIVTQ
tara:strand:- start:1753 stop:2445 length:693 start_codon:yes stop_codon:yes gene_type:complete